MTNEDLEKRFPIYSEALEPTFAFVVGRLFARYEAAGDDPDLVESALMSLWWALHGMKKITIAASTAIHASIATSNHIRWGGAPHKGTMRNRSLRTSHVECPHLTFPPCGAQAPQWGAPMLQTQT